MTGGILPDVTNTYDLGSDSKRWGHGHFDFVYYRVFQGSENTSYIKTKQLVDKSLKFQTYTGAGFVDVLILQSGKIKVPNIPVADPADGTSTLWCDAAAGNVVKVGT